MAHGAPAALVIVDELAATEQLRDSHLLPSVRGELLLQLGRDDDARHELERAIARCPNARERTVLERKLASLD
jgi:predicted RNA polymerase sigma factor